LFDFSDKNNQMPRISFIILSAGILSLTSGCQPSGKVETEKVTSSQKNAGNEISEVQPGTNIPIQRITSMPIPETVIFAGDTIPVQRQDVKEALENELMVNTFRQSHTLKIIKNFERWKGFVSELLKNSEVPEDFIYLAVIESEFDNNACSYAGAMGMWQIMEKTAKDYDLIMTRDVDMRRDPRLATEAACRFLKWSHNQLGDWVLTAASYNVGVNGIKNRMEDQKVDNFFDLHLNSETSRYVYRIIALKLILENPEAYGYYVSPDEKYPPYKFSTITIDKDIRNLVDFARENQTTYKELRQLNPWFNNTSDFKLSVPKKKTLEIRLPQR
jgi:membrane-bound lytic murein transglycosylase D